MWEWIQTNWPQTAGIALILSWFVEIAPIKINPWSKILRHVGRMCNQDLYDRFDDLEVRHKDSYRLINDELSAIRIEADEREAKRLRASLLSFTDSCKHYKKHSQAQFENVLRDYDDYLALCEKHNIQNHYVDDSMDYVRRLYQKNLRRGTFS